MNGKTVRLRSSVVDKYYARQRIVGLKRQNLTANCRMCRKNCVMNEYMGSCGPLMAEQGSCCRLQGAVLGKCRA